MHHHPAPPNTKEQYPRLIISTFLALFLLMGLIPAMISHPSMAEANENVSRDSSVGNAQLTKVSTDEAISSANQNYSLGKGVFAAFSSIDAAQNACLLAKHKPWVTVTAAQEWAEENAQMCFITTDNGTSNSVENVAVGEYFAVELLATKGFRLSSAIMPFTVQPAVNASAVSIIDFMSDPQCGSIDLLTQSNYPSLTDHNGAYSLEGATYGIFTDAACLNQYGEITTSLTSAYEGGGHLDRVPIGTYWIKETKRPDKGYALDPQVYNLVVTDLATESINGGAVIEKAKLNPLGILLIKKDAQTKENFAQGAASLGDAHFLVNYYDVANGTVEELEAKDPRSSWTVRTDDNGLFLLDKANSTFTHRNADGSEQELPYLISGDEFYRLPDGCFALPLGTYTVQEIKAPKGYLLDSTIHLRHIDDSDHNDEVVNTFQAEQGADELINRVARANLSFVRTADDTTNPAGIPFKITSKTTGEWHIVVTDDSGAASTATDATTSSANFNDAQFRAEDGSFVLPETIDATKLDAAAGVWFGLTAAGESVPLDGTLGALPYDIYEVEEIRCPGNALSSLIYDEVAIDVANEGAMVDLGILSSNASENPSIRTSARDRDSGTHEGVAAQQVAIVDTVTYQGLIAGEEYRLRAVLMDKNADGPFTLNETIVTTECTFIPEHSAGTVDVQLDIVDADLNNATLVVFESLMYQESEIALHADIDDEEQTVTYVQPEDGAPLEDETQFENDGQAEDDGQPEESSPSPEDSDDASGKSSKTNGDAATAVSKLAQSGDALGIPLCLAAGSAIVGAVLILRCLRRQSRTEKN